MPYRHSTSILPKNLRITLLLFGFLAMFDARTMAAPPLDYQFPQTIVVTDSYGNGNLEIAGPPISPILQTVIRILPTHTPLDRKNSYVMQVHGLRRVPESDPRGSMMDSLMSHYPKLSGDDIFPLMGDFFRVGEFLDRDSFTIVKCHAEEIPPCLPLRKDTLIMPLPGSLGLGYLVNFKIVTNGSWNSNDYKEWPKGVISESPSIYRLNVNVLTNSLTKMTTTVVDAKEGTIVEIPIGRLQVRQIVLPNPAKKHLGFIEFTVLEPQSKPEGRDAKVEGSEKKPSFAPKREVSPQSPKS